MTDRLSQLFSELQDDEEPVALEAFTDRAAAGEFGPVEARELGEFLRAMEEQLVHRIEHGESGAHDATLPEDLIEETRAWISDLVARYCGPGGERP